MKPEDDIQLWWCAKHRQWANLNCPECMLEINESDIKREGMREVVEWIKTHTLIEPDKDSLTQFEPFYQVTEAFLKEKGGFIND